MTEGRTQGSGIGKNRLKNLLSLFCLLIPVFCLPSCGFHSIYAARGGNTPVAAELNSVAIAGIPGRHGQVLRNDLIDAMYTQGRPQNPAYTLSIKLGAGEEGLGILQNAVSTLTELTVTANYTLTDQKGKVLVSGSAHAVSSFNQISAQYGTLAAEEDAYRRTLTEVGDQIVNRLSLYFSEGPLPGANLKPPKPSPTAHTGPVAIPGVPIAP
ncbi:MAG TPA: LPS assembly lipoprotein LptE [Alphaproteobacteria bacterium]|nr:LPS assembly lipoprotein LptE [Alphaproteobacteria bacterium]